MRNILCMKYKWRLGYTLRVTMFMVILHSTNRLDEWKNIETYVWWRIFWSIMRWWTSVGITYSYELFVTKKDGDQDINESIERKKEYVCRDRYRKEGISLLVKYGAKIQVKTIRECIVYWNEYSISYIDILFILRHSSSLYILSSFAIFRSKVQRIESKRYMYRRYKNDLNERYKRERDVWKIYKQTRLI